MTAAGAPGGKDPGAFRTIGEVSSDLGVAQHVLRYWETRFPQLRPLQRAGNRRYYRPEDVALVRQIDQWLNHQGYTVKGVQQLLRAREPVPVAAEPSPPPAPAATMPARDEGLLDALRQVRERLRRSLD